MLGKVLEFISGPLADFFGRVYINNGIFFADNYTFVHLAGGFLIMLLLFLFFKELKLRYKFLIIFILILGWEILEILLVWFKRDLWVNRIWDVVIEMLGGLLFLGVRKSFRWEKFQKT